MTTTNETSLSSFPPFLQSPDGFAAHLSDHFLEESNEVKGEAFLHFAMKFVPLCDFWKGFSAPEPSPTKSHDKGVDFAARNAQRGQLAAGQSKYRITQVGEFDSVISKFQNYETHVNRGQASFGTQLELGLANADRILFVIITSSNLSGILRRYRDSSMSSRAYFEQLERDKRIEIIDGARLLRELQALYRQNYILAPRIELPLSANYLHSKDVYLSFVTGKSLADLYAEHGSSLFFENIREFLGEGEEREGEAVNKDILKTLEEEPEKMLGRNNGITIKADKVSPSGDRSLILENSSIVNGCQTTMCIVHAGESAHRAEILVKIVEGGDSWDIAKAANNQNRVSRIDLELAKFLRPQLVRKAAIDMGFGQPPSEEKQTVSNVLESIHRDRVSYEAIRMLYLGIFSRSPKNMWQLNYSEVRIDVLARFSDEGRDEKLLRTLFQLLARLREAVTRLQTRHQGEAYASLFKRFFDDRNPKYQCFLAILAACGCLDDSLIKKAPEASVEYQRLENFISKLDVVLEKSPRIFNTVLQEAFVVVADRILDNISADEGEGAIQQRMYRETEAMAGATFERIFTKLRMHMVNRDGLIEALPKLD